MYRSSQIRSRILLGFALAAFAFVALATVSIVGVNTLTGSVTDIYSHPLKVSNASLQASQSVTRIHRSMKDVALFEDGETIDYDLAIVDREEANAYRNLDIIREYILGDEGRELERASRQMLDRWKPIRQEVIELTRAGKREAAARITKGKGAAHVDLLENKMLEMNAYARSKADSFMSSALTVQRRVAVAVFSLAALSALAVLFIASKTVKLVMSAVTELDRSEDRYRTLFESSGDAIVTVSDDGGSFNDCNSAALELYGFNNKSEFMRYNPGQLSPAKQPDGSSSMEKAAQMVEKAKTQGHHAFEWTHKRVDGAEFISLVSLCQLELGGVPQVMCIVRDITAIKEMQEEVKALRGILPICSYCKKIRDDKGYWDQVEAYISRQTEAEFTHGICPECLGKAYEEAGLDPREIERDEKGLPK